MVVNENNRRENHWIEAFGERKTIAQWSRDPRCVVTERALISRIHNGWDAEEAITTPMKKKVKTFLLTAFGETKSYCQWAKDPRCVVSRVCLRHRIESGWNPEKAITTPILKSRKWVDKEMYLDQ